MDKLNYQNGRVKILGSQEKNQFDLYDKIPISDNSSFRDALTGTWETSELSNTYFSSQNIQTLQNGIRQGVYDKSNGIYMIGQQDVDTLKVIMRSIFIQHSAHLSDNIMGQVQELNKLVLDYCIPQVYGEAEGYMKYKHDISTLAVPMQRPAAASYKTKTLEQKPWF